MVDFDSDLFDDYDFLKFILPPLILLTAIGWGFFLDGFLPSSFFTGFSNSLGVLPGIAVALLTLVIAEIVFLKSNDKPSAKESVFWFTMREKQWSILGGLLLSIIVVGFGIFLYGLLRFTISNFGGIAAFLAVAVQAVSVLALVLAVFLAYIWVNTLKFRNRKGAGKK